MSKLTINTKEFLKELSYVAGITYSKTNQNWGFVLIEVDGSVLRMTGTDGCNAAVTHITLPEPVSAPLEVAVDPTRLQNALRLLTQETVTLSFTEKKLSLIAGKTRLSFVNAVLAPHHIKPMTKTVVEGNVVTANAAKFIQAVQVAATFAAKDETTKYTLMGVMVDAKPDHLLVYSMDGHRAADIKVEDVVEGRNDKVFLSAEAFGLLANIGDGEQISITKGNSVMRVECGNRVAFIRRAAAENLPAMSPYLDKFLETGEIQITTQTSALMNSVKLLMQNGAGKLRKIMFNVDNGKLVLSCADPNNGEMFVDELTADVAGSGQFSINAGYVLDYTKHSASMVTIKYNPSQPKAAPVFTDGRLRCMISVLV